MQFRMSEAPKQGTLPNWSICPTRGQFSSKQCFAGRLTLPPILKVWFIKHQVDTDRAKFTDFSQGNQALTIGGFLDLPATLMMPPTSSQDEEKMHSVVFPIEADSQLSRTLGDGVKKGNHKRKLCLQMFSQRIYKCSMPYLDIFQVVLVFVQVTAVHVSLPLDKWTSLQINFGLVFHVGKFFKQI